MKLELLLLCTGWCVYIANATAIVCVEHHWSISILSEEIRAHHSSPREPHWLKVPERLQYLLCVLVHRCLHGTGPPYMAKSLHLTTHVTLMLVEASDRPARLLTPFCQLAGLDLATGHF